MHRMFKGRHEILLEQFPDTVHSAVAPLKPIFDQICGGKSGRPYIRVQQFAQLNGEGGFHRILHPGVNALATVPPPTPILRGAGCVEMRSVVAEFRGRVENKLRGGYAHVFVDRAPCLALLPMTLTFSRASMVAVRVRSRSRHVRVALCVEARCTPAPSRGYSNATHIRVETDRLKRDHAACFRHAEDVMVAVVISRLV